MLLPVVAFFGLLVGDGLFLHWWLTQYQGITAALQDHLALSFMIDSLLTLCILTVYFEIGRASCRERV